MVVVVEPAEFVAVTVYKVAGLKLVGVPLMKPNTSIVNPGGKSGVIVYELAGPVTVGPSNRNCPMVIRITAG
jgi:hypothetical protein